MWRQSSPRWPPSDAVAAAPAPLEPSSLKFALPPMRPPHTGSPSGQAAPQQPPPVGESATLAYSAHNVSPAVAARQAAFMAASSSSSANLREAQTSPTSSRAALAPEEAQPPPVLSRAALAPEEVGMEPGALPEMTEEVRQRLAHAFEEVEASVAREAQTRQESQRLSTEIAELKRQATARAHEERLSELKAQQAFEENHALAAEVAELRRELAACTRVRETLAEREAEAMRNAVAETDALRSEVAELRAQERQFQESLCLSFELADTGGGRHSGNAADGKAGAGAVPVSAGELDGLEQLVASLVDVLGDEPASPRSRSSRGGGSNAGAATGRIDLR
eukprot:NODE_10768_length_1330_cov_4.825436.p1 GENE.NODE_10768_length_1330_cov_4.825436~~NODE_10768_length_1330_cov_4.825436.p1  ORF type:complete len:337 (-),score=115.96 NODE_10768_length_1330_cov_4.825436:163-1173(-)